MEYKVGDKVRVKSKEWYDSQPKNENGYIAPTNGAWFNCSMTEFCGKEAIITHESANSYLLDISEGIWEWCDYMLEDVDTEEADSKEYSNPRYNMHRELLDKMHETYKAKNTAYGNSFDKSIDKYGYTAALVRIEDKKNRLDQLLLEGGAVNDEAIEDTCLDMANYSIMLAMYLLEKKGNAEAKSE